MKGPSPEAVGRAADWSAVLAIVVTGSVFVLKHFGPWDPDTDAGDLLLVGICATILGIRVVWRLLSPVSDDGVHFETGGGRSWLFLALFAGALMAAGGVVAVVWALIAGKQGGPPA
ncbi:hypothetical protein GCM10009827_005800 [Dactylosporangium maewongense]|uniref:Integral membrane protein n=1 Tax=Dactylosporangium maewongense TaxID=634393 RepID=A0ABN1ZKE4_9ACTN